MGIKEVELNIKITSKVNNAYKEYCENTLCQNCKIKGELCDSLELLRQYKENK